MLESLFRPQFREAVAYQPLHWFNGLQLQQVQRGLVKNRPNIQQGDILIHFAGLMGDKREFMGPWLDGVENKENQWTVPLENTTYLRDVEEYWYTYGQARDMLDGANQALSLQLRDTQLWQPVVKALKKLQNLVWIAACDIEEMQSHTDFLADTLEQAILQKSAAEDQLRAEKVKAASSKAEILEL